MDLSTTAPFAIFIGLCVALSVWLMISRKRHYLLWTVVLALLAVGCLLLWLRALEWARWKAAFRQFNALCEVQNTGTMPQFSDTPKLLLLNASPLAGPELHVWQNNLPEQATPKQPGELDLVLCLKMDYVEIEVCQYQPAGALVRRRIDYQIQVFDPRTSQKVLEGVLTGSAPNYCPSSYRSDERVDVDGELSTWADLKGWLDQQLGICLPE